jgi:hypothetical protein
MKRILIVVVVAALLAGGYYYLEGPCGTNRVTRARIATGALISRWIDIEQIAASSPRIALAGPVRELQDARQAVTRLDVPACMQPTKENMLIAMQSSIDGYLAFMGQDDDYQVSLYFDSATEHMKVVTDNIATVKRCAPFCP